LESLLDVSNWVLISKALLSPFIIAKSTIELPIRNSLKAIVFFVPYFFNKS
jgi:hypothetical protein